MLNTSYYQKIKKLVDDERLSMNIIIAPPKNQLLFS